MDNFSPITVKRSPAVSTPGKNLTGLPRTISDTVADIHNFIQKWNTCHLRGIEISRELISFIPTDSNIDMMVENDLHNLTLELHNLFISCSEVVNNIESSCERIVAMAKLYNQEVIPFSSMPLCKIDKIARFIHEAYEKELKNKKLVVENIAFSKTESETIFFGCLWKYQMNIDEMVNMNLEILLTETGHRKIT